MMPSAEPFLAAAFCPGDATVFWESAQGRTLLAGSLERLAAVAPGPQTVVLTSEPRLVAAVAPPDLPILPLSGPVPATAADTLARLARTFADRAGRAATALFVDLLFSFDAPGNPFAAALARQTPGTLLLSAVTCRDHPCQFVQPEVLRGVGFLHLLEPAEANAARLPGLADGARLSRPFPWHWAMYRVFTAPAQAGYVLDETTQALRPVGTAPAGFPETPVLLWETPETARLAFAPAYVAHLTRLAGLGPGEALAGWSGERPQPMLLAIRDGARRLRLRSGSPEPDGKLTVQPLYGPERLGTEVAGDCAGLMVAPEADETPCGYVFSLEGRTTDGRGDWLRPYAPSAAVWPLPAATDDRPIAGRQDFPEVFTPDWGLVLGEGPLLADWAGPAALPPWQPLPELAGIRLDTPARVLRHLARLKAKAHATRD